MSTLKVWMTLCLLLVSLCLLLGSGIPASAAVTRQPYLQMVTPTSMTIAWQTDLTSANDSRVQYGTSLSLLNQTAFGSAVTPPLPSNNMIKNHVVTITGLSPGIKYFYRVGTVTTNAVQAGGTSNHFFVTAPLVGTATPFTAWIVGDSGDGSADQEAVRNAMLAETGSTPPDLFLHAGDMAYESGTDPEFTDNYFAVYQDILRQTPLWPTIGNHESFSSASAGIGPYYEAHVLPMGGEAGGVSSGTEAYYSFNYANVHFIVLDSMTSSRSPGSAMLTWLQSDLSGTTQEWVIALFHHPPYTKGSHDSDSVADSDGRLVDMREDVLPILEAGGVDLVLAGHSHIYERSFPLSGAYGKGSSPNFATPNKSTLISDGNILDAGDGKPSGDGAYKTGTVYVVAGHGGRSVGSGSADHPVMFFSEREFGSVLLDINGSMLTVRNVRSTGAITDTFSIDKKSSANIVWRNLANGSAAVWLTNGLGPFTGGVVGGAPMVWNIVGVGDLNGNGTDDLVWRNTMSGEVAGWLVNGLSVSESGVIAGAPGEWKVVGVGDLNGNGTEDLVWRNTTNGSVAGWLLNGLGAFTGSVIGSAPLEWEIVGVGDLNNNGTADLVWRNMTTGSVAGWLLNGLGAFTGGDIGAAPLEWEIVGVGDLNNNGTADLVWRNMTTGSVAGWLLNGLGPFTGGDIGVAPLEWEIKNVGDIDNNGTVDLVWRNKTNGTVAGWLLNGLTESGAGVIGGAVPLEWEIR